jgi:hypothetical protein
MRERWMATREVEQILPIADQARRMLEEPQLTAGARASLHIVLSGVYGRLTELRVDTISNGQVAFAALSAAVRLAPTKTAVAESYGRTLLSFSELNWAARKFVTLSAGINMGKEVRKTLGYLAASPDHPMSQVVRERLARWLGDDERLREAQGALSQIEARDPEGVAAARAGLDSDKERAEASKAKGGSES